VDATGHNGAQLGTGFSAKQHRALDLIASGMSDREVGEALAVDRSSVWRWRTHDPDFQAELNQRRNDLWQSSVERLRALIPQAIDALGDELRGPNRHRAAETILKHAGLDASRTPLDLSVCGPTSAQAVKASQAAEAHIDELLAPY
jgi:hypothetical protein